MLRTLPLLLLAVPLLAGLLAGPAGAESYLVTAQTVLANDSRDGEGLVQTWTASCDADDPAEGAALTTTGKDLRSFTAPEQAIEVGVDTTAFDVDDEANGRYSYRAIAGSRVFARLTVRCGTATVFDEIVADSAPLITPPALALPSAIVDTATLATTSTITAGKSVELQGVSVFANPRGAETVDVVIRHSAPEQAQAPLVTMTFSPTDFRDGVATVSPQLTAPSTGDLIIEATFLGTTSPPLVLRIEPARDDGNGDGDPQDAAASCASINGAAPTFVAALMLFMRRRR